MTVDDLIHRLKLTHTGTLPVFFDVRARVYNDEDPDGTKIAFIAPVLNVDFDAQNGRIILRNTP